jgi:hypothetical protein
VDTPPSSPLPGADGLRVHPYFGHGSTDVVFDRGFDTCLDFLRQLGYMCLGIDGHKTPNPKRLGSILRKMRAHLDDPSHAAGLLLDERSQGFASDRDPSESILCDGYPRRLAVPGS